MGSPYAQHHPQNVNLNLNLNPMLGEAAVGGAAAGAAAAGAGAGVTGPMMGAGVDPNLRHFDGLRAENQNYC